MTNQKINNMLIPNVTKLNGQKNVDVENKLKPGETSEFKSLLDQNIEKSEPQKELSKLVGEKVKEPIQFSTHALRRLQERNLSFDKEELTKLQNAMDKLKTKGGQDSLVITGKAAYIVDVPKNTIVTAIDKESMSENVFTKIDSTILMN